MWPFRREQHVHLHLGGESEERASIEDPRVSISDPNVLALIFGEAESETGENVSPDTALRVPAVWAAVNFLSGTIASLPLKVYRRDGETREVDEANRWHRRLNNTPNPEWTSYRWRKYSMLRTLLQGRSYTFVDRASGTLWPLEKSKTTAKRVGGRVVYEYRPDGETAKDMRTYGADEIIDIPFILDEDPLETISPVERLKDVIGLSLALQKYAARHFRNGGMPPAVLQGPQMSPGAASRASEDIKQAIANAVRQGRIPAVPEGYEIKTLGIDPEKSQMEASRRFQIEEIARVYDLPPVFLQDLTHGTYCLPADAEVLAESGPTRIVDVRMGDRVYSRAPSGGFVLSRVSRIGCTGSDPILTIRTTNRTLRLNAKHRVLARRSYERPLEPGEIGGRNIGGRKVRVEWKTEYVPAGDLREGDTVVAFNGVPDTGKRVSPTRPLTEGFMEFCGLYIGDGNIERGQSGRPSAVVISRADHVSYMDHYRDVIRSEFARYEHGQKDMAAVALAPMTFNERPRATRFSSTLAAQELVDLGFGGTAHEKRVPEWVFGIADDLKLAFLRGFLDADGSVDKKGRASFASCNPYLLSGVRHLCMMLGIPVTNQYTREGNTRLPNGKHIDYRMHYFTCSDPGANQRIGSHTPEYVKRMEGGTPFSDRKGRAYPKFGGRGFDEPGAELSRINSIEVGESEPVYDMEVSGTHNFIADGVVVHNSNTEQQDLHFVKHTLTHWTRFIEQELNQKLFRHGGRRADTDHFCEFSLEGLLRGDFRTRMDGLARGVQNALLTPNEARKMDNRPPMEGGDNLWLQRNMEQLEMLDDMGMPAQNGGSQSQGGGAQNE